MNDELKKRCEQSFYSELYHFDETSQDLVIDETTGRVMLRKVLSNYDINVFKWLKDNSNIHIPAIYSFFEEDSKLTVLEEYIQGKTLDAVLETEKLDFSEKIRILSDVCDALIFLHNAPVPIIHRDIKGLNIMLTNDGIVKLVDFDASRIFHPGKDKDTTLIGTVGSAAPEQYGFGQSDARTDIYALGILMKELFHDDNRFDRIIDKATQLEPKLRYQSVAEMKKAIEKEIHPEKKARLPLILIALCLIAVLFSAAFFTFKHISTLIIEEIGRNASYSREVSEKPVLETTPLNDIGYSDQADIASGTGNNDQVVNNIGLSIDESSWYAVPDSYSSGVYILYAAAVSNSSNTPIEYPGIGVTAKNKKDIVLGTDDMVGSCIMPGDTIILDGQIHASDCTPSDIAIVNFVINHGDLAPSRQAATSDDFTITGINMHNDSLFPNVTGEITSKYHEIISTVSITAVFRNKSKLVATSTDYINDLRPGTPTAFQINFSDNLPEYDTVEIVAKTW